MTIAPDRLAAGFPTTDRGKWHELVAKAMARSHPGLEPGEVEGRLGRPTDDGYTVKPLYTPEDRQGLEPPAAPGRIDFIRGALPADQRAGWRIQQRYWGSKDEIAAAAAEGLANGVNGLWLTLLPDRITIDETAHLLAELDLAGVDVTLEAFANADQVASQLLRLAPGPGSDASHSLGLDPLGLLAGTGRLPDTKVAVDLAHRASEHGLLAFSIDASIFHDAGASFGEELAAATASGLATLRWLVQSGLTVDQAAGLLEFRFAVTDDQFASIAKLRAARLVWSRVLEVAGATQDRGQWQHAVTSWPMLSRRDAWVNLIRNTVACFAAGTGGADAVTVQPHNMAGQVPDVLAQRMARNTQHLLLQESHVGVVDDPLGGSWYGETRTRELAEAAWEWVQEIEGSGGMEAALRSGHVARRIERSWDREATRIARRKSPLTGVSEFPDRERTNGQPPGPEVFHRPGGGLPQHRWAEQFEALRDASDRAVASGQKVVVQLLTVGSRASHSARLGFAENLFAAGGIDTTVRALESEGDASAEVPDGSTESRVFCICGSDKDYAEGVSQWSEKLPEATIWLAGRPGDLGEAFAHAGIDGYLYAGCNVLDVLRTTLADLEVSL